MRRIKKKSDKAFKNKTIRPSSNPVYLVRGYMF